MSTLNVMKFSFTHNVYLLQLFRVSSGLLNSMLYGAEIRKTWMGDHNNVTREVLEQVLEHSLHRWLKKNWSTLFSE